MLTWKKSYFYHVIQVNPFHKHSRDGGKYVLTEKDEN